MDLGLRDRVYVLTGASQGIGYATAAALTAEGARVVVSSRDPDRIAAAAASLGPDCAVGVAADNGSPDTPQRLAAAASDRFGRLDGAFISVGGPPGGTAAEATDDQWRAAFESVFLGAVRLARVLAARLGEGGSLVFLLSSSVRVPIPGLAISNGLRPGLAGVAKTLAAELGPAGIRVNGLVPGKIDTERVRWLDERTGDAAAARAANEQQIPLRRYGDPAEVGRAAAFLLSPAASYISGAMIRVDGGAIRSI